MNGVVALLTIVDRFGRDAVDTRQFDVSTLQLTIRCQVSGSQDIRLVLDGGGIEFTGPVRPNRY